MTFTGLLSRMRRNWWRLSGAYPCFDRNIFIHYTVEIKSLYPRQIAIESDVHISKHAWINIPSDCNQVHNVIRIARGTCLGRNNVVSARNRIEIGEKCVTGPQVLIMDHAHEFRDVTRPIMDQGTTSGGQIVIESGCWIGFGAVVVCNRGTLQIGRNSVVGANAVVTKDVPPFTVVAGIPARPIKQFDSRQGKWIQVKDA